MKIYLLRHAKTDQKSPTGKDFDRKLLPKGKGQCALLRTYLKGLEVDAVWCSAAKRTRETLKLVGLNKADVTYSEDLYLCPHVTYLEKIWAYNGSGPLFIVGHNFGISELASYFTEEFIEMRTGELIGIYFDVDSWKETSRGNGVIFDRYRPVPS